MSRERVELQAPCANCPFLKAGAIDLQPGRLEEIIAKLLRSDRQTFLCHKFVYGPDSVGERRHTTTCAGAMVYLLKIDRPNIWMRLMFATGKMSRDKLMQSADAVIDPPNLENEL